ncbi:MAG TPA: nickel-responsive transcriptional regulator NikR [Bacillales bacterium]|nr:nickel-responsive transcriptional regulator NikR [Bacillales bacterium]
MVKENLIRFGVSMPQSLIDQFDQEITNKGYGNRSEALRDLVRKSFLGHDQLEASQPVAGTIVMVYQHHAADLSTYLMELQHQYHKDIISTMHIHLNLDQCLEILVVDGKLNRLRKLHQSIQVQKGVLFAELSVTHVEKEEAASHYGASCHFT